MLNNIDGMLNCWQAKWIGFPGRCLGSWHNQVQPAPYFRKGFKLEQLPRQAMIAICGIGYYELYLNGRKVGDHVLDPVVTQYDKRLRYVVYDVAEYLVAGENVMGVVLGNGWYNCHTPDVWHFDKASWRDYPKMLLQLELDGNVALVSDSSWKVTSGPIVFDGLRNGETYDARLELDGWLTPGYNTEKWRDTVRVNPPGGLLQRQTMPPCKVMQTLKPAANWTVDGKTVYDFAQNLTGWVRITVKGEAGAEITIRYGERLSASRDVDQSHIGMFIKGGDCQTDRYTLRGGKQEIWEPRFTYHGFQYASVAIDGAAEIVKIEARLVYTSFASAGTFSCSDETVNRLQQCTWWSFVSNFTGIPTDCPHREKNGWTGDAQLAAETGLFNFAAAPAYNQWMDSFVDAQRPSGQLPGIVPSTGWGYNWGSGPAWDSAFLLIPWYVYLYTGDTSAINAHYPEMKKYVDYCTSMADGHIVSFGLGDWCHVDNARMAETALTSTGYYYADCVLLAKFAAITNRTDDRQKYEQLAADIKTAFNRRFYHGNGVYGKGEQTAQACAVYQGLVEESEKALAVARLVDAVKACGNKLDFGILGAKYTPRVLAENGHADLAYHLITQPEQPGWVHWLKQGATTLWEDWFGNASLNHIMYGDISAWFFQYLAGIAPDPENPGFKHVLIQPHPVPALQWARGEHTVASGTIIAAWKVNDGKFELEVTLPPEITATVILPDGRRCELSQGTHRLK